ncbi:MAG: DUF2523 domain-containing protein [Burkholderiales bacterium]|nr:DUF2523 domain-containing protein [Burkholderiales bacterium]
MTGGLGTWLVALASPIARQVLLALGIGVVSFAGIDAVVGQLLGAAKTAWSGLPGAVAAYVAVSGVNTGLALVGGAITARLALIPLKSLRLL